MKSEKTKIEKASEEVPLGEGEDDRVEDPLQENEVEWEERYKVHHVHFPAKRITLGALLGPPELEEGVDDYLKGDLACQTCVEYRSN